MSHDKHAVVVPRQFTKAPTPQDQAEDLRAHLHLMSAELQLVREQAAILRKLVLMLRSMARMETLNGRAVQWSKALESIEIALTLTK